MRVPQEQEFEPLGSSRTHQLNVSLVAATHRKSAGDDKAGRVSRSLLPPERISDLCSIVACKSRRHSIAGGAFCRVIQRAVMLSNDSVLANPLPAPEIQDKSISRPPSTLKEVERDLIPQALEDHGWTVGGSKGATAKLG